MTQSQFPAGWDADRVKKLVDHYENLPDDEITAEDDAAQTERAGQAIVVVPDELLPAIRHLIATHKAG